MLLKERYKSTASRENKRSISAVRSVVTEVPLHKSYILLPNKKIEGVDNEVDEFSSLNKWIDINNLILIEQDKNLACDLAKYYIPRKIPVFHTKLSRFLKEWCGKVSYMHADYCATVNAEATAVLRNLRGKIAEDGAVLRFTHSRRNNYRFFHLNDSRKLLLWLKKKQVLSGKEVDNLYYQALKFQTDPTLRVGLQILTNHVMGKNTLENDPIACYGEAGYEIKACDVDKYCDTGANMQTIRFVLKPAKVTFPVVIRSLYNVYNALY